MNFLELARQTYALLRIGQGEIGNEPVSVTGQTGKLWEVVNFVSMAWQDIQNCQPSWRFMAKEGTLTLPAGQSIISPSAIDDFDLLLLADADGRGRSITLYGDDQSNEQVIRFVAWGDFQQSYLQRGARGVGQPSTFTLRPDGRLEFDLTADLPYTVRLFYKRTPQALVEDSDTPIMPAKYHKAIVWWVVYNYYCVTRDDSNSFAANAKRNLDREMRILFHEQLDEHLCIEVQA